MEGEIVRSEAPALSRRAQLTQAALKEEVEQRALLGQYVKACMVDGTDYGKIPGTEKPTLLKPGAEKLIALFHCEPRFELVKDQCATDFERGFFKYTFRCIVVAPGGAVLAEGYGSANSREARYRWRDGKRKCPECGHGEALLKSKKEPGFFCWEKKGGCGANFGPDDKRITEQQVGKVENPDIADLDNTILKMAKKRAQVDAAIALARCSDMFTQDVEDFAGHQEETARPAPRAAPGSQQDQEPMENLPPVSVARGNGTDPAPGKSERKGKPACLLTIEEAEKKDRTKEMVHFGTRFKGRIIAELADDELGEVLTEGEAKLAENPTHWASNALRNNLKLLTLEYETREKRAGINTMPLGTP